MGKLFSNYWILIASGWYLINGILHDIFVIIQHNGKYDRELLRLLMDGHVLILSGIIGFLCYGLMQNKNASASAICFTLAIFMLIYCAMIFPFLKSFVTITISTILAIVSAKNYFA